MATRESLKKLNVKSLRVLADEKKINTIKRKKDDIISDILDSNTESSCITPVVYQVSSTDAVTPNSKENLPPFNKVYYRKDVDKLPIISFSMIYDFMISRKNESGTPARNMKSLDRAVKHCDACDINDIQFSKIDETTFYVKGFCHASMKRQKYQVYICMTQWLDDKYSIDYAFCQCPVGLGQGCSHIGGLLFTMSSRPDLGRGDAELSCTSLPCQWKVPRANIKPQPISSLKKNKPKIADLGKVSHQTSAHLPQTTFDPRHSDDRPSSMSTIQTNLQTLKDIFPSTGMSLLWNIHDQVPEYTNEVEVSTQVNPLDSMMQQMIFSDSKAPPAEISFELVKYIEEKTRTQRLCDNWKQLHIGRITSSMFADIMHAGSNNTSLIKTIVEGSSLNRYSSLPAAVQWGIDKENIARAQYVQHKRKYSKNFSVSPTGLTLLQSHSFLGASGDGIVNDEGSMGILEIKCPYSLQGCNISQMEIPDILALENKGFCLETAHGQTPLRKNHRYYAQVQGEMAVMGLPWCDFVVWTGASKNNLNIDRIYFDTEFVSTMMPKLLQFYMENIYPIYYTD